MKSNAPFSMTLYYGFLLFVGLVFSLSVAAQPPQAPEEAAVEAAAARTDDTDDALPDTATLEQLLRRPLNLNRANEQALQALGMLTPLQINHFLDYRERFGALLSIYELQAVPGWDIPLLQRLRPYISVIDEVSLHAEVRKDIAAGRHQLWLTISRRFWEGHTPASRTEQSYPGSPYRVLLRYRFTGGGLQWGVTGEKDAGEAFFGGAQRRGFDFYSAYLFLQRQKGLRTLALGDFSVQWGQGLIQWQGFSPGKGGEVWRIKKEGAPLLPYRATGEYNFHRGIGLVWGKRHWRLMGFGSLRRLDANLVADSSAPDLLQVSTIQKTGYHRTATELADRNVLWQRATGMQLEYNHRQWRMGGNCLQYQFGIPFATTSALYRRFDFTGKRLVNNSVYYDFTWRNVHLFGELAFSSGGGKAVVQGGLATLASGVDFVAHLRHITPGFHHFSAQPFTEGTGMQPEQGVYFATVLRPTAAWQVQCYADFYRFNWLRYRTDAPSANQEMGIQALWKPNKRVEAFGRFRFAATVVNDTETPGPLPAPVPMPVRQGRVAIQCRLNAHWTLRQRAEWVVRSGGENRREEGFMFYNELLYKPLQSSIEGGFRVMFFDTDSYAARIYTFENNLPSGTIPAFYGQGWRLFANARVRTRKNISFWLRAGQTIFFNKGLIINGLNTASQSNSLDLAGQINWMF
jgi:hypothetical protein